MGSQEHRELAGDRAVSCAVITASDTRTPETDESGRHIRERLVAEGHRVLSAEIVPDEPEPIERAIAAAIDAGAEVVLLNGGTGIARRDRTFDAVDRLLEKRLPGFGELFRMLSFEQVGAAAMLSRATAGVHRGRLLISIPGSRPAVELAMERLILPELPHLAWELTRG
jgi:molybdopterin adenylyltransferase